MCITNTLYLICKRSKCIYIYIHINQRMFTLLITLIILGASEGTNTAVAVTAKFWMNQYTSMHRCKLVNNYLRINYSNNLSWSSYSFRRVVSSHQSYSTLITVYCALYTKFIRYRILLTVTR